LDNVTLTLHSPVSAVIVFRELDSSHPSVPLPCFSHPANHNKDQGRSFDFFLARNGLRMGMPSKAQRRERMIVGWDGL